MLVLLKETCLVVVLPGHSAIRSDFLILGFYLMSILEL
jgi:hypothetical protein